MSALLIGHITVKDPELWEVYTEGVERSLEPFKGEILARGKLASVLAGSHSHMQSVVIRFADLATLNNWYHSELYQGLIPVRDAAADVIIASYEA